MDRDELERYIRERYGIEPDYPWAEYPSFAVFRLRNSKKWFALMMDIPRNKVGLPEDGIFSVVNLKCDPMLVGALRTEPGIFPAYHMNKENWITAALDGSVSAERMSELIEMSYTIIESNRRGK